MNKTQKKKWWDEHIKSPINPHLENENHMTRKENMNDSLKALSRRVDESEMDGDTEIKRKRKGKRAKKRAR